MREDFHQEPADRSQKEPWEPWDDAGTYQTGSTRPPKSHGGLITVLLIVVILLAGIASALGLLNIRMFQALQAQEAVSFTGTDGTVPTQTAPIVSTAPEQPSGGDHQLPLSQAPQGTPNATQEGGLSLQEIYEQVIPSVVSITCQVDGGTVSGTGVVLTQDGYLVTNCHVVSDARAVSVLFTDGRELPAAIVGTDPASDLAVLYVDAQDLTPAEFGDSATLRVGDTVAAIGDPLGAAFRGTLTNGIVSAINRDVTTGGRTMALIQTNAALNEGNSGGPLINCHGQVIGINTLKIGDYMSAAGVEGLGFAIPSATVKEVVDQLLSQGYVSGRPTLGIEVTDVSTMYQMFYRLPQGAYVTQVTPGGAAEEAGLRAGDILVYLNGQRITDASDYTSALYTTEIGEQISLVIYREGRQYEVTITVAEATKD